MQHLLTEHLLTESFSKTRLYQIASCAMNLQSIIKIGLAFVTLALCALIALKPVVNNEFHIKYLENLDALDAMSGSLVRNHLLVMHGHTRHYDFLEADLQKMERFAQLALLSPNHVSERFQQTVKSYVDDYLSKYASIVML